MKFNIGDKVVPVDFLGISGEILLQLLRRLNKQFLIVKDIRRHIRDDKYDLLIFEEDIHYEFSSHRFIPYEEPKSEEPKKEKYFICLESPVGYFNSVEEAVEYAKNLNLNGYFYVGKLEKKFVSETSVTWKEEK